MKRSKQIFLSLSVASLIIFFSCKKSSKVNDNLPGATYGTEAVLGKGTVRSFVIMNDAGKPETIGMQFSASALDNLPTDSTKEYEFPVELPEEAKVTGFDHLAVDWNPVGHDPKPIYGLPHFDFHFYRITKEEQAAVIPGPDNVPVPETYVPKDYISGMIAVPDMGVHWVDSKAPEFTGQKFTDTFIYGFYHGELTFMEPMITREFLLTKPDFIINIKQPRAFQKQGYYPTFSHIRYDASSNEYIMTLGGLEWRDVNTEN
jgi:hypothetical protein